eukprot:gnl/Hemi2/13412_TR4600_c0_g1_i1.p2 gnl/Hemi2/13412_TR4600_c0_g1~~gnl/Hemi2/13412_TR4600_c0_g1_i1.p2  ORF type:complete len:375 (-),score=170.66 gnl/Hemi2/13412_TR4600_c0_g1_i1:355-1479(-)
MGFVCVETDKKKREMMKAVVLLLVGLAALVAASDVKVLGGDNFDSVVDGSKGAFVEFYAPWCGHCKALEPKYELVGTAFAKHAGAVVVAKVNADEASNKDLAGRFGVKGYPTLKWFPKGSTTPEDYNGGREAQDIVDFINSKTGLRARVANAAPSDVTVLTADNFDEVVMNDNKVAFVEFYAPWCGHCKNLAPKWDKLAGVFKSEEGVVIAKVDCDAHKETCNRYDVKGFPTLKTFLPGKKDAPEPYSGERELDGLVAHVNSVAGTFRLASGSLSHEAGRVASLDTIAAKQASGAHATAAEEIETASASLSGQAAKDAAIYLRISKSLAADAGYVATETARVRTMLDNKSVSPKQADNFQRRLNILEAFTASSD